MILVPISKLRWQSKDLNSKIIDLNAKNPNYIIVTIFNESTGEIYSYLQLESVPKAITYISNLVRGVA
jgi:hypothetical protein